MGDRLDVVSNVIRFPGTAERGASDVETVHGPAPSRSLIDSLLEEAGISGRDAVGGLAAEIGYQMRCFDCGYGSEATVLQFRQRVDAETARAAGLIRSFDVTADRLMRLERAVARRELVSADDRRRLRALREQFRGEAIAARAAADAAIGATAALATFVRDGTREMTGSVSEPRQLVLFAAG